MKKLLMCVLAILMCTVTIPVLANDQVLLKGNFENSGFGGPIIRGTKINDNIGILMGGYGGWFINHCFLIGLGGCGLANEIKAPVSDLNPLNQLYLNLGYGGLVLEYVDQSHELMHLSLNTLVGAGGVGYAEDMSSDSIYSDPFFVIEPAINGELNMTQYFRISLGASYRYITGVNLTGISDKDLSGFSVNLAFKFGAF